jgi:ABC-type Mn2+/Zn2+ transport system permease subunit
VLDWLSEPFASPLVRHALVAGLIVTLICAIVGTWVVLRGAAFLGEAMAHGVLPGVALASVMGGNIVFGAMAAALAMAYGVSALGTSKRFSADTSIGLLLVGMLALGVIVVSHSRSFATDLTALLFGDVLAATTADLIGLAVALVCIAAIAFFGRRAFVAATFDVRKAATLGLHPRMAVATLTVLMAAAIVASFQVVGTLLMLGLLVAPPAAALVWARSVSEIMMGAAIIGSVSVAIGLAVSWHASTAGGATIAITAVALFFVSLSAKALSSRLRSTAVVAAAAAGVVGCASTADQGMPPAPTSAVATEGAEHNKSSPDVIELADAPTRLVIVDSTTGTTEVFDALDETGVIVGEFGTVRGLVGDGRYGYLIGENETTIVDSGAWTYYHGDHNHYYAKPPSTAGTSDLGAAGVTADDGVVALHARGEKPTLLDRKALGEGRIEPPEVAPDLADARVVAPYGDALVVAAATGELRAVDQQDDVTVLPVPCADAAGATATRSAVVLTCRDGAVRIAGADTPEATAIPFPAGEHPVLVPLKNRGREGTLVGRDGDQVWLLDSTKQTWDVTAVPGAVAAGSAGDGQVLVLTGDGVLRVFDMTTGTPTAELALFTDGLPADAPPPVIEVDADRAYINNAAAQAVYEIDYRGGLRLARTLRTGVTPDLMLETGR